MEYRNYSSEGIILARKNYSEADRILTVFTKHFGKVSLLAKGIRKPKSRKRGHLEVFSHIKFSASGGGNLDLMQEAETIESFSGIRSNLKKIAVAYFFVEVTTKLTRENEKHEELFLFLNDYLNRLKGAKSLKELRFQFVHDTLSSLGFWPRQKLMGDPDRILREITEREISSARVGKRILT